MVGPINLFKRGALNRQAGFDKCPQQEIDFCAQTTCINEIFIQSENSLADH